MERQYEEGLTAGELGRMIVKRLWIVILAAIAVAALLTAAFAFVINPLGRDYSMEFYLTYPGSDTLKYPDGSSFSYRELISPEALASVKASDERFGSIDTVAMVEKDDISITAEYAAVGGEYMLTGNYTIAVAGKYFSSRDTAQAFIRGIARQAVENVMEKASAIDYSIDEGVFSEASFEDKLSLLEGERESILAAYDEWIEEYRASYSVGGKSLSAYRAEAAVSCGAGELRSLREELESCEENRRPYYDYCFAGHTDEVIENHLTLNHAYLLFGIEHELYTFLCRTFANPTILHPLTPLCEYFFLHSRNGNEAKAYLHLREERCDLIVYKQGRLLLGNTFDFNTADDVAYFTLLAWKQLSLDQTRDRLYLAGEKSLRQPLTALLQTYIKNVLPYPFPSQLFRLGKETIDAPFELITIPLCGL